MNEPASDRSIVYFVFHFALSGIDLLSTSTWIIDGMFEHINAFVTAVFSSP